MLTYLDSSILAAWVLNSDRQHAKAETIIQEIESQQMDAITSSIAIMEVIDAIRRRIAEKSAYQGDPAKQDMSNVKHEIEEAIKTFLDGLTTLAANDKLILTDPESPMKEILDEAVDLLCATFGRFEQTFKDSRTCYVYRGVGQYDVQHALIAKALKADILLTFDRAFSDLASNPIFAGIVTFTIR
jgi:predicted nucleic acid-binding protein